MPAQSKAQQQAAGIALAAKRGDIPKSTLKGASASMAKMGSGELKKFAKTKSSGLPKHVSERAQRIVARLLEDGPPSKPVVARLGTGPAARYRNTLGDPVGTLYYATPEDWAEWQRLSAKGMPVLGPEAAPKEALKNKYGGNPPLPPQ